jgi:hypothetical protein
MSAEYFEFQQRPHVPWPVKRCCNQNSEFSGNLVPFLAASNSS